MRCLVCIPAQTQTSHHLVGPTMNKYALLMTAVFLWIGCVTEPRPNQSLAIMELGRKTGPELVYLANDYGFLIYWPDNMEPELYIYDKPANRIKMTSDFSAFLSDLRHFPKGPKVDRIRGCAITAAGMPQDHKERLNEVTEAREFTLTNSDDGNFGVCSCETTYLRRYKTANKSAH